MRVLVHDFGAYAFPVTLSRALQDRGYEVGHAFCNSLVTTPCNVRKNSSGVTFLPIQTAHPINKYNLVHRWMQDQEYGRLATRVILDFKPDIVISANAPLKAQQHIQKACRRKGIPFVFWLQDLIGLGISRVLKSKLPLSLLQNSKTEGVVSLRMLIGAIGRGVSTILQGAPFFASAIGYYFQRIEAQMLQRSDAVISITEDFSAPLQKFGVDPDRCHVIENWGILDPFKGNSSTWTKQHQFPERPILLYAGTLSMKHNPATLLHLAQEIGEQAQIVVVSQGAGAEWLAEAIREHHLSNLTVLPYQPPEELPAMYAAAKILMVLLTEDAGKFSVPSKVLTCLCSGKPILAAIPEDNLAARIIKRAKAGFVVEPDNHEEFIQKAQMLLNDPELCKSMGQKAEQWANQNFAIGQITDRFEHVLKQVSW